MGANDERGMLAALAEELDRRADEAGRYAPGADAYRDAARLARQAADGRAPTAWTTERPTEPVWYWVRGGGPAGRIVELDDDLHVSGIGSDMHKHIASGSFDDLEWQHAEPKP